MQTVRQTADEQYKLIMECCSSGLSDFQWCMEYGIKPSTFYNWVKRLRKKGCYNIPPATGRGTYKPSEQQDVVKLEIVDQPALPEATAEINIGSALIRISNDIDSTLMSQIIRAVEGTSC